MSKIKSKLSKWFLGLADKLDHETYRNETMVIPLTGQPMNVTMYNPNHIEILHIQQQVSNYELQGMKNCNIDVDMHIRRKLVDTMAYELIERYKDNIKKDCGENPYGESTTYSLDVYVCKPQNKKEGDI